MSKLNIDTLKKGIVQILEGSKDKPRKFLETVELQIGLKDYVQVELDDADRSPFDEVTCGAMDTANDSEVAEILIAEQGSDGRPLLIERFNWELCDDAEGLSPIRILEIDIAFPPTILDPIDTDCMNLLADHTADDPTADINYFAGAVADDDSDGDCDLEAELAKGDGGRCF